MKRSRSSLRGMGLRVLLSIPLLGLTAASLGAQEPGNSGLDAARFLVGCWAQPAPEGNGLREFYAPPANNLLTGLSQFWRGGEIVDFEFHRIDDSPAGPVLTPHPKGVASVSFQPSAIEPGRIVWENPEHDFPQRIIYARVAPDTLVARVEGGEGASARSAEWRMARTECPAA